MNADLLARMRDIHELDPVSWWPPALGWWLVGTVGLALLAGSIWLIHHLRAYPPGSWHRDARNQLLALKKLNASMSPEYSLRELSELLRRIAVTRLGREQAAGLTGQAWLEWLEAHDPKHFSWTQHGQPLLEAPYAPPGDIHIERQQVLRLIQATLYWTRRERKTS